MHQTFGLKVIKHFIVSSPSLFWLLCFNFISFDPLEYHMSLFLLQSMPMQWFWFRMLKCRHVQRGLTLTADSLFIRPQLCHQQIHFCHSCCVCLKVNRTASAKSRLEPLFVHPHIYFLLLKMLQQS